MISVPVSEPNAEVIRSRLRLKVAGEMAALKVTAERCPTRCHDDYHGTPGEPGAIGLAEWLTNGSDSDSRDAVIREVEDEVTNMFKDPAVWAIVEDLAARLAASPEMLYPDIAAFFGEFGVVMAPLRVIQLAG